MGLIPSLVPLPPLPRPKLRGDYHERTNTAGPFFLDSGAFSLYAIHGKTSARRKYDYAYFKSPEFWEYVDRYAAFVRARPVSIDYYANVDVIYNPQMSWEVLKYLEKEHGLHPVPVIHSKTDLKWVDKHLEAGYPYIGFGGNVGATSEIWLDQVFERVCPGPSRMPLVKTHGFAMTSFRVMSRYPWFSVDSASWVKAGAFGRIYVPHKRNGKFTFEVPPYCICVSSESQSIRPRNEHIMSAPPKIYKLVEEWVTSIGLVMGKCGPQNEIIEWGVTSHDKPRYIANLRFFEALANSLPPYPQPFRYGAKKGLLE